MRARTVVSGCPLFVCDVVSFVLFYMKFELVKSFLELHSLGFVMAVPAVWGNSPIGRCAVWLVVECTW